MLHTYTLFFALFLVYVPCSFAQDTSEDINYPALRHLPKDSQKLKTILAYIAAQETGNGAATNGSFRQFQTFQHINKNEYLAYLTLGRGFHQQKNKNLIKLELKKDSKIVADGTIITRFVTEANSVYQYQNVMGAKNTIKVWKEIAQPEVLIVSTESILRRLKEGEKFTVKKSSRKQIQCKTCTGSGKVYSARTASRKTTCRDCGGKGTSTIGNMQWIHVKW